MGIGSPRLLGQFVRRTAAVALVALGFAPSAFADDGIGIATDAGPVAATVEVSAKPTVEATADVDPPAPARVDPAAVETRVAPAEGTLVAMQLPARNLTLRASSHDGKATSVAPRSPLRIASVSRPHEVGAPETVLNPDLKMPLSGSEADFAPVQASEHAAGLDERAAQLPRAPLPVPTGFAGSSSGSAGGGPAPLLFALAAALAAALLPRLGRKLSLWVPPPRPYRYLLALERPD